MKGVGTWMADLSGNPYFKENNQLFRETTIATIPVPPNPPLHLRPRPRTRTNNR